MMFGGRFSSILRGSSTVCTTGSRSFFQSSTGSSKQKAKVVMIGSGRMGDIRGKILQSNPKFDFAGIVDVNKEGADALAQKYGVNSYSGLSEAMQDTSSSSGGSLDGIVLCTPTPTHGSLIQEAAQCGISGVFTEKPVGETAEEIEALFGIADAANMILACGFQRRFDHSYQAATQAVRDSKIGTPISATIFFADHPAPPKEFMLTGGDIFLDLCAHDVDYITHTLGDDIVSVYATGTSMDPDLKQAKIHDNAVMVMNFARGAMATLFMSRSATYGYDQRCEIFGDLGMLSVMNQSETTMILSDDSGIQHPRLKHSFPERFEQAFGSELDAFADTLLEGNEKPWPITAQQCIKVQKVADAARKSCLQGQLVHIEY